MGAVLIGSVLNASAVAFTISPMTRSEGVAEVERLICVVVTLFNSAGRRPGLQGFSLSLPAELASLGLPLVSESAVGVLPPPPARRLVTRH